MALKPKAHRSISHHKAGALVSSDGTATTSARQSTVPVAASTPRLTIERLTSA
jgi:hypothetical protein